MNAHQLFEQFKADWKRDLSTLTFSGTILTGSGGLVSIDLAQAKMFVRRQPDLNLSFTSLCPSRPGQTLPKSSNKSWDRGAKLCGICRIGTGGVDPAATIDGIKRKKGWRIRQPISWQF
jgi:hypothetical protein